MNDQLFYESISDAIRPVVHALGGSKKVGPLLWPSKPAIQAAQRVTDCLNDGRPEKFSPDELLMLARWGKEAGCHTLIFHLCGEAGYTQPQPLSQADEKAELQRQFIESVNKMTKLASRIERLP